MQHVCETCKKEKKMASFRYTSRPLGSAVARRIFSKFCKPCRVAALLRDPKKLARAIAREEINAVEGRALRAKIEARHAANHAATAKRMRKQVMEMHEQHRLMLLEHGISHAVFNEMRLKNPEQAEGLLTNVKARHASIKARAKKGDRWALNLLAKLGVRATPKPGEIGRAHV